MGRPGNGINLRRAAQGRLSAVGQPNNTTWSLRNNTASSELLLVWWFQCNPNISNNDLFLFSQQRTFTAFAATTPTFPIVPTDAPPPGQLGYFNSTVAFTPQWGWLNTTLTPAFIGTFPFTVLSPGWSLCVQDNSVTTNAIEISIWWEAIAPEEFEYLYGDTGLAVKRPAGAV